MVKVLIWLVDRRNCVKTLWLYYPLRRTADSAMCVVVVIGKSCSGWIVFVATP